MIYFTCVDNVFFLYCFAAYAKRKSDQEKMEHENETKYLKDILEAASFGVPVREIEKEEDVLYNERLKKVKYYEQGLEKVLDIRCSVFKTRQEREKVQDELVNRLFNADKDMSDIIKYDALKDVYTNDWQFCRLTKESNGKLRQLYVKNWKLQLELDKYKNIVERFKTERKS